MKTNKAAFQTALAEIAEVASSDPGHPYLTVAKFVFADDKPASTSTSMSGMTQGIEYEDFDEVAKTAIDTPVKMRYLDGTVGNHLGAYVIGHIKSMDKAEASDGAHQLIASAVLYADEFPEEITFLKEAYASGKAPGISYEIAYADSVVKDGVQWIKKAITCAATFVRSPAYGQRTALLALASAKDESEFTNTLKTLVAQAEGQPGEGNNNPETKGGNPQVEEELKQAREEASTFKAEAQTKSSEISKLSETITAKDEEIKTLNETVATLKREKVLAERVRAYTDAGMTLDAEASKADAKKNFLVSMSDEVFTQYIEDVKSLKAAAQSPADKAMASLRTSTPAMPRPEVVEASIGIPSFKLRD
jgi:hypothetical protein